MLGLSNFLIFFWLVFWSFLDQVDSNLFYAKKSKKKPRFRMAEISLIAWLCGEASCI